MHHLNPGGLFWHRRIPIEFSEAHRQGVSCVLRGTWASDELGGPITLQPITNTNTETTNTQSKQLRGGGGGCGWWVGVTNSAGVTLGTKCQSQAYHKEGVRDGGGKEGGQE